MLQIFMDLFRNCLDAKIKLLVISRITSSG